MPHRVMHPKAHYNGIQKKKKRVIHKKTGSGFDKPRKLAQDKSYCIPVCS